MLEALWNRGLIPRPVLAASASLYRLGWRLDRAWKRRTPPQRLPVPVVSVGNLAVGGTGKTPLAAYVAAHYAAQGLTVALLTRGYGRSERRAPVVYWPTRGLDAPLSATGDEARVLALLCPDAAVVVDPDRARGGRHAISALGAQVLVLDDGFQRRVSLARDLDLIAADAADPSAGGALLPLGRQREPLAMAAEAAHPALVLAAASRPAAMLPEELSRMPRFDALTQPRALRPWAGAPERPLAWLKGRTVAAFCGLATPSRFAATLRGLGAELAFMAPQGDHAAPTAHGLVALSRWGRVQGAEALVCTLKDFVKLPQAAQGGLRLPLYALETGLAVKPAAAFHRHLGAALAPRDK